MRNRYFLLIIIFFIFIFQINVTYGRNVRFLQGTIKCDESQWVVFTYWGINMLDLDSIFLHKGDNHIQFRGIEASNGDEDCYTLTFRKSSAQLWLYFTSDTIIVNINLELPLNHINFDIGGAVLNSPATIEYYK